MDDATQQDAHIAAHSDGGRKITRIEVSVVSYPMTNVAQEPSSGEIIDMPDAVTPRERLFVRIETADGATGEYLGGTSAMLAQATTSAKYMIGKDCFAREQHYAAMKRKLRKSDRMGPGLIDIALWDLAGKRLGASITDLLGGFRTRLPAYASTLFGGETGGLSTPENYRDFAEQCHEMGFRAFKVHGWTDGNVAREVANIRLLGRSVGDRMALMLDPSCQLRTFSDTLQVGRACDEAGFLWIEDPFSDGGLSINAHQRLKGLIKTPILLGEHVRGLEAMAAYAVSGATDFLRADPDFDLGITGTMKLAHMAEAFGLDIEIHAPGPAQRHCMAAIRNTNYYELSMVGPNGHGFSCPGLYVCDYSDALESVGSDGCYPVPKGQGLGVAYDHTRIRDTTLSNIVFD